MKRKWPGTTYSKKSCSTKESNNGCVKFHKLGSIVWIWRKQNKLESSMFFLLFSMQQVIERHNQYSEIGRLYHSPILVRSLCLFFYFLSIIINPFASSIIFTMFSLKFKNTELREISWAILDSMKRKPSACSWRKKLTKFRN